jgi:dTDP-4-dehydrorhamnose reductase
MAVNSTAPAILAEEALRSGGLLVHYSTDYVFDGTKQGAWTEDDAPHPLNVYGASKLAGEDAIRHVGGKHLIFRTSWVYGPHGHNFLLTMLHRGGAGEQLSIVDDQVGAPTSVIEVARATRKIVDGVLAGQFGPGDEWAGLYQMTCGGSVSWYGFAQAIFRRAQGLLQGKNPTVRPISSSGYPSPARRPRNSVLSNEKLCTRFGLRLPPWESALDEVMREVAATNETFRKLPL